MSTNQLRRYLDLLNEAETTSRLIANQPFIPGQPLSPVQMAAVDLANRMGNNIPPDVQQAYNLAKQAGINPGPVIRDRTDSTNKQSVETNARSGQPPSQFIPTHFHKNFLGGRIPLMQTPDGKFWWMTNDSDNPRAGKTIQPWVGNTTDRSSMASVDGTIVNNKPVEFPNGTNWQQNSGQVQSATPGIDPNELVPPNTNVALPSSGTFSNDQALANLAAKIKAAKAAVQRFEPTDSNTDSAESLELLRQLRELGQQISNLPDAINSTDIEAGLAEIKNDTAIAGKMTSLLKQMAALPETSVSYITRKEALDIIEASRDKIIRRSKAVEAKVQQGVKDAARSSGSVAPTGGGATPTGGGSTSPSGGGSSTPTGVQDGPGLAGGQRCAVCGTPQSQHQNLQHQFAPGGAADRPAPVPQGGSGGGADVSRIKQLQRDLIAAGAKNLGTTGPNRDGVDGDIGSRTREAMQKYPAVAAKYADLNASQGSTPGNVEKLNAALTTIEGILAKYKVKLSEDRESSTPTDQMRQWRSLIEYSELTELDRKRRPTKSEIEAYLKNLPPDPGSSKTVAAEPVAPAKPASPTNPYVQRPGGSREAQAWQAEKAAQQAAQQAAQTTSTSAAGQGAAAAGQGSAAAGQGSAATTAAGKGALRGAATIAGKAAGKALPGVGLALGAYDAYNRTKEGDYLGAGISGLAGLAALVPLVGTAASLGLTGVNVYRDLNKNPSVAITPEDAAVITQNLKIIQDWQKDPANQAALTPELKNRIENIIKGVAAVGVPTAQAATPATPASAPAPAPAPAPAATSAANSKVDQVNQTLNSMDQLLKKNKYESISNKKSPPLTEAERMARLRDIVTEDVSDWVTNALTGYGGYKAWQAAKDWRTGSKSTAPGPGSGATPPPAAAGSPSWLAKLNKGLSMVWKTGLFTTKWGLIAAGAAAMVVLWDTFKENPEVARVAGINPDDMKQFAELYTQLNQIVGDEASFKALPPEVQQKATDIAKRALKMAAGIANRKSVEPEPP